MANRASVSRPTCLRISRLLHPAKLGLLLAALPVGSALAEPTYQADTLAQARYVWSMLKGPALMDIAFQDTLESGLVPPEILPMMLTVSHEIDADMMVPLLAGAMQENMPLETLNQCSQWVQGSEAMKALPLLQQTSEQFIHELRPQDYPVPPPLTPAQVGDLQRMVPEACVSAWGSTWSLLTRSPSIHRQAYDMIAAKTCASLSREQHESLSEPAQLALCERYLQGVDAAD